MALHGTKKGSSMATNRTTIIISSLESGYIRLKVTIHTLQKPKNVDYCNFTTVLLKAYCPVIYKVTMITISQITLFTVHPIRDRCTEQYISLPYLTTFAILRERSEG